MNLSENLPAAAEGQLLDPGFGLLDHLPPRRRGLGRFLRLSTCSPWGAVALATTLVGLVIEGLVLGGQLFGAELKGVERHGAASFHLFAASLLALGGAGYGCFAYRKREHLALARHGAAVRGRLQDVEVVARGAWWRRGASGWRRAVVANPDSGGLARYRFRYLFEVDGEIHEGEDLVDTRHGNGELSMLPTPWPGDELTVLFDPRDPTRNVAALGVAEGLPSP